MSLGEKRFYAYILLETAGNYVIHDKEFFLVLEHGLTDAQLEMALDYLEQIHYPTGNSSTRIH